MAQYMSMYMGKSDTGTHLLFLVTKDTDVQGFSCVNNSFDFTISGICTKRRALFIKCVEEAKGMNI